MHFMIDSSSEKNHQKGWQRERRRENKTNRKIKTVKMSNWLTAAAATVAEVAYKYTVCDSDKHFKWIVYKTPPYAIAQGPPSRIQSFINGIVLLFVVVAAVIVVAAVALSLPLLFSLFSFSLIRANHYYSLEIILWCDNNNTKKNSSRNKCL